MKKLNLVLMLPFMTVFALQAYAADTVPGLVDSLMSLFGVIKDKAAAAVIVMHVFQILRTNEVIGILGKIGLEGKSMRVAVAVITTLGYVSVAWAKSGNIGAAFVEGLFTAGGAMLIFDAFKSSQEVVSVKALAGNKKILKNLA